MYWEQSVQYGSRSDVGLRRQNNQDVCVVQMSASREEWKQYGHLFMVADGMGGHAAGELASKIAADTVPHTFFKSRDLQTGAALKEAIEAANKVINKRGNENPDFQRMGTTCTTIVFCSEGAVIGHVGDSRCYRVRNGQIHQLSFDHSLQWELIRRGNMKPEDVFLKEPRHVITRSLGPEPEVQVDIEGPYPIMGGDKYLLCSDGLNGHLKDAEIGTIVNELAPGDACRLLVNLANLRGGSDNVTVVVAEVSERSGNETLTDEPEPEEIKIAGKNNLFWIIAAWILAIVLLAGICLTLLLEKKLPGAMMVALSVLFAGALFFFWNRNRSIDDPQRAGSDATVLWKPYRTAKAKLTRKFLSHLAAVESELYRTVQEENWKVDTLKLDATYEQAKQALAHDDHSGALKYFAKAIDILMVGMNDYRKQMHHDAKWG